jgi:aspartate/tyrosine/aromatic aminotransferase
VESFPRIAFSDKILGITEAFKADSFKEKINLGVLKQ